MSKFKMHRVACPKFGQPALGSEFCKHALNTGVVANFDILRKKNHYSYAETISKKFKFFAKLFFPCKN